MVTPAETGVLRDALLVAGADVLYVRDALHALEQRARLNGGGAPARLQALLEMVDEVARPTVTALLVDLQVVPDAGHSSVDALGTDEVAALLGCTGRYVRQQCDRGTFATARKQANRWIVDRAEVLSFAAVRASTDG